MNDSHTTLQPSPASNSVSHSGLGHAMDYRILLAVWGALLVFTYITVTVTYVDLGSLNLIAALVIATIKASLVVLFFMHMLYDHPFHALVFIVALSFVALFVVIVLIDTAQYLPDMIPGYAPGLNK